MLLLLVLPLLSLLLHDYAALIRSAIMVTMNEHRVSSGHEGRGWV
uniref:Uncharacterized protein n=1 Tax=Callorhinchus milii TaxID=7868 RepID=A0A4W3GEI7_CALMI